ncbi:hypothetical protein CMI37_07555 [Candidatus Pacearchaeota archaeon]|jgi:hypothetical protein|nr:hypothetical protein [Candidatus Pacearchaeota archaeon]
MPLRPARGRIQRVDHLKYGPALPGGRKIYHLPDWKTMSDRSRVAYLRRLMLRFGRDPRIRNLAINIVRRAGVKPRDYQGQAKALLQWVQTSIFYANEPSELIQAPGYTTDPKVMSGDCDDIALLIGSLATSIRLDVKLTLSGRNRRTGKMVRWVEGTREPGNVKWAHVYVMIGWPPFRPTHWEAAEGTLAGAPLGWDVTRAHLYPRIAGAPGVPAFPEFGELGILDIARPPPPPYSPPKPPPEPFPLSGREKMVAQVIQEKGIDAKEKVQRRQNRIRGFIAGLDWSQIAVATIPALISGVVLARLVRK